MNRAEAIIQLTRLRDHLTMKHGQSNDARLLFDALQCALRDMLEIQADESGRGSV